MDVHALVLEEARKLGCTVRVFRYGFGSIVSLDRKRWGVLNFVGPMCAMTAGSVFGVEYDLQTCCGCTSALNNENNGNKNSNCSSNNTSKNNNSEKMEATIISSLLQP